MTMSLWQVVFVSRSVESSKILNYASMYHRQRIFNSSFENPRKTCWCSLTSSRKNNPVRQYSEFPATYSPQKIEEKGRYDAWMKNGSFKPKLNNVNREVFSIILPPPNVTGTLHLGHALTVTLQDVLCRWKRMQGHSVVWVPGFDHAGIATQVVVEKKLKNERNVSRHDLGREEFIKEVMSWKEDKIGVIRNQLKKLGASLDWSRETFTMDKEQSLAVKEAVIRLFESGALYREEMLVNWSCFLQSAISDIEVEHKEISKPTNFVVPGYENPITFGLLYDFAYKFVDKEGEIVVSTTRIETMLGDVAVAVHPSDERYQGLEGTLLHHPFQNHSIPLIFDETVISDFGTGAVKITPAHSHSDFQVAKTHKLPSIQVINEKGLLMESCGSFSGLKRYDARSEIIKALEEKGLFRGSKPHKMAVPCCSRSGDVVELLLRPQWFVNLSDAAKKITSALSENEIDVEPASYKKMLLNWFSDDLRDWCISRQIWWGHRLPLYFAKDTWVAAHSVEDAKLKFKNKLNLTDTELSNLEIRQDEDVLDTWFSSALLPFSVFGWPNDTEDLKQFYPLSLMETGNDIVCFWVARMLSLGVFATNRFPFKKIMLHGMIGDPHGRKMSKTRGNVIDPLHVINGASLEELNEELKKTFETGYLSKEEYQKALKGQKLLFPEGMMECGADALRLTLSSHDFRNLFISFDWKECVKNKRFANKILNVCKFIETWREKYPAPDSHPENSSSFIETWILSRLAYTVKRVDEGLSNNNFHHATHAILFFLFEEFCDIFVEASKPVLNGSCEADALSMSHTLHFCMETFLRLLAPFMPFLTEEFYFLLVKKHVHDASFPNPEHYKNYSNLTVEADFKNLLEIIKGIRRLKKDHKVPEEDDNFVIKTNNVDKILPLKDLVKDLARCSSVTISEEAPPSHYFMDLIDENTCVYQLMNLENFNFTNYRKRLVLEEAKLKRLITNWNRELSTPAYQKIAERLKQQDKRKIDKLTIRLEALSKYLDAVDKWEPKT